MNGYRNRDRTEVLVVRADKKKLGLSTEAKTFDLESALDGLAVYVDLYSRTPSVFPYCTDIADSKAEKPTTWKGKKGTLTITLSEPEPRPEGMSRTYKATIKLENVVFEDAKGNQARMKEAIILEAMVGWYAG